MGKNPRKYGIPPFRVVMVHGGPGAAGQMAPVARELSTDRGVLEPLQTECTLRGQVEELKSVLEVNAELPVILVGHSWGAWLVYLVAAIYPRLVKKLVLIGSGPLEEAYAGRILDIRLERLEKGERNKVRLLLLQLNDPEIEKKNALLEKLGYWFTKSDAFDPFTLDSGQVDIDFLIHQQVWKEASELRRNGRLLKLGESITCPVVAIHGDYDPHPSGGVRGPLSRVLKDFRFHLLKNCGHIPWIEKQSRSEFFKILDMEIRT